MRSFNVHWSQLLNLPVRYIKQRNPLQCGPVAVLNYWKWRGDNVTAKDLKRAAKTCGYEPRLGTPCKNMTRVLGKRPRRATWGQIKRALAAGKIIFIEEFCPRIDAKHSWLIIGQVTDKPWVLGVNADSESTYTVLPYQAIVASLRYSRVWFLDRPGGSN